MKKLTIATRGSKLALWQANHTRDRLIEAAEGEPEVELLILKTKGDKILDVPLAKVGGKGLFVKEIENALLDGRADIAVHSMKDVPAELEPGLHMAAVSERAEPRDAFCSSKVSSLRDLPQGAVVGTSSLRRGAQVRALRPDLEIRSLRGNVPTRLDKLDAGGFDAIILAAAGLERLGFADYITAKMSLEDSLPAVGQGALGIETRVSDAETSALVVKAMNHGRDASRIEAERAFLHALEGGCQAPMAAYAQYDGETLVIDGLVGEPDGSKILRASRRGTQAQAAELGRGVAQDLLDQGAGPILEALIEAAKTS
ncbi:MAG: hydroxymethylbilane synthase [Myxococcales bacterium]|nr:hydroxymethylbilane synthase [Myxococcales bacterium]